MQSLYHKQLSIGRKCSSAICFFLDYANGSNHQWTLYFFETILDLEAAESVMRTLYKIRNIAPT